MRGIVAACALVLAGGMAEAAPLPWQEVTYSSEESFAGGTSSTTLRQFDPAKGNLISARVETSGSATFRLDTGGPITAPTPYAFKLNYYIYYANHSFDLTLAGSQTLAPNQGSYTLLAEGKGGGAVSGAALAPLKGTGTLKLGFSNDLPTPPPPMMKSFEATKRTGSVRITYRYYPSLRIDPKKLPPVQTLPRPGQLPNGGAVPKP